jgi:hypothetical protein
MTNLTRTQTQRGIAVATASSWLVPPVVIPILLTIMIGVRAVYVAYPW